MKAKADELQKLLDFDVYTEMDNKGQDCVSATWVTTKNGEQVKEWGTSKSSFSDQRT